MQNLGIANTIQNLYVFIKIENIVGVKMNDFGICFHIHNDDLQTEH